MFSVLAIGSLQVIAPRGPLVCRLAGKRDHPDRTLAAEAEPIWFEVYRAIWWKRIWANRSSCVDKPGGGGLWVQPDRGAKTGWLHHWGQLDFQLLPESYSASSYRRLEEPSVDRAGQPRPRAFTVKSDAPGRRIEEALAFAQANPMKVRISNSGPGGSGMFQPALLGSKTGIQFTHVPYGGGNPAAVPQPAACGSDDGEPGRVGTLSGRQTPDPGHCLDQSRRPVPDVPTI